VPIRRPRGLLGSRDGPGRPAVRRHTIASHLRGRGKNRCSCSPGAILASNSQAPGLLCCCVEPAAGYLSHAHQSPPRSYRRCCLISPAPMVAPCVTTHCRRPGRPTSRAAERPSVPSPTCTAGGARITPSPERRQGGAKKPNLRRSDPGACLRVLDPHSSFYDPKA